MKIVIIKPLMMILKVMKFMHLIQHALTLKKIKPHKKMIKQILLRKKEKTNFIKGMLIKKQRNKLLKRMNENNNDD